MTDILLITEQSIKNLTNISDNMSGKLLLPAIREAQEINLREILGDNLLDEIKRQVYEGDVRETYSTLILQCQYYLAYQACANICMITSVKIDNAGLQRVSDEKMEPLPVSEVNQIHDYYQKKADFYCERLQNFLLTHKGDYPELNTRQCNSINANLYSSATCGIFLGGPRSKNVNRGYGDGLNSSNSITKENLDVEITENGSYDYTPKGYGYSKVHIDVNTPETPGTPCNIGAINVTLSANEKYDITAAQYGYDGLSLVKAFVSVPSDTQSFRIPNQWNGSVDVEGLKALNWTDEQIATYQSLCTWMDNENDSHLVSDYDKNIETKHSYKGDTELTYVKNIDFSALATNAYNQMFKDCTSLRAFPTIEFPAQSITNCIGMFDSCSSLEVITGVDFTKSNNNYVSYMFYGCSSLVIAPEIDFSTVSLAQDFFQNCTSLKYIPDYDFDIATNILGFYQNTAIEEIGNVIAPNCLKANYLLADCPNLKKVGRIYMADACNNNKMFQNCPALEYVGGFSYRGTYNNGTLFTVEMTNLTHFIMEDYLNCTWDTGFLTYCPNLDYESIKSILTACSNTTSPDTAKSITFNSTIQDQNNELSNLVADCVSNKGWTINGLTIE